MGNTVIKGNSFGEVIEALKLKGVKACRESWRNNYYICFNEEQYTIDDTNGDGFDCFDTEELFAEDWVIVYPN